MKFYIWSWRHRQWWGPDRGGYTLDLSRAGQYTQQDVGDIVTGGLPGSGTAVDETLAEQMRGWLPGNVEARLDELRRI